MRPARRANHPSLSTDRDQSLGSARDAAFRQDKGHARALARYTLGEKIAALLPPSNIVVDLDVATKPQFFAAIGRVFEQSSGLAQASVAASLAARQWNAACACGSGKKFKHCHGRLA